MTGKPEDRPAPPPGRHEGAGASEASADSPVTASRDSPIEPTAIFRDADRTPPSPAREVRPPGGEALRELPNHFGRYRVEKLLGRGGMGAVYLAHDTRLDRPVALKIPKLGAEDSPEVIERFLREARAAAALSHPNLCPVYDAGETDGIYYLTMAYLEGRPLSARLKEGPPLEPREAALLVREIALALAEAHDHGVIHRDLKPANIMITTKGRPIVMDFGLARQAVQTDENQLTQSGAILGTPAYMSPEQVRGESSAIGPASDLYSLGVVLYELLACRLPFSGSLGSLLASILHDPPPSPSQFRPEIAPALESICLRAMAKEPQDRYASMTAMAEALDEYLRADSRTPRPGLEPTVALSERPPLSCAAIAAADPTPSGRLPAAQPARGSSAVRFLLGCLAVTASVMLLIIGTIVGLVWLASNSLPKLSDMFQEEMQKNQYWADASRLWTPPPADAGPEQLFPNRVGLHRQVAHDSLADIGDLRLQHKGFHAVYQNGDRVELYAYPASKLEIEALLRRAYETIRPADQDGFGSEDDAPRPYYLRGSLDGPYLAYDLGPQAKTPARYGFFWWDRDWLFLARSATLNEPGDFFKEYLLALRRTASRAAPSPSE